MFKKVILFFIACVLLHSVSLAQVEITVNVLQAFSPKAKLLRYNGSDFVPVDSSMQVGQGSYRFILPTGYSKGMYRVDVGKNINLSVVVSNEPLIDISTTVFAPEDSLKSLHSKENTLYWRYQSQKKRHKQLQWHLNSLQSYYSPADSFYIQLADQIQTQHINLYNSANQLVAANPDMLAAKYIGIEQNPAAFSSDISPEKLNSLWWDNIDLFNPLVASSPSLRTRIWSYMELVFSDSLDKEEQELAFVKAIHLLLSRPMDIEVQRTIRTMLIEGFEGTDYVDVFDYLQYTAFQKLPAISKPQKKQRDKSAPRVRVGDKAYDFCVPTTQGENVCISKLNADYKLVLFWSSWCPHCVESMPHIRNIYNLYKGKGFEVIAIALDEEEGVWQRYITDLGLTWVNMQQSIDFDHEILTKYNVTETPMMFLLSNDLTIVSRPSSYKQLEAKLRKLIRQ